MATTHNTVSPGAWVLVNAGACLVDIKNHARGRLHTGTSAPATDTKAWHEVSISAPFSYGGSQNVYLFTDDERGLDYVVTDGV